VATTGGVASAATTTVTPPPQDVVTGVLAYSYSIQINFTAPGSPVPGSFQGTLVVSWPDGGPVSVPLAGTTAQLTAITGSQPIALIAGGQASSVPVQIGYYSNDPTTIEVIAVPDPATPPADLSFGVAEVQLLPLRLQVPGQPPQLVTYRTATLTLTVSADSTAELGTQVVYFSVSTPQFPNIYTPTLKVTFNILPVTVMIQNKLTGHVIDIQGNSTANGAPLDAYHAKLGSGENSTNQQWQFLPDPAGSGHYIIQNPFTLQAIGIKGNSTTDGALLGAYNINADSGEDWSGQIWQLIPDPAGSGYYFIQNMLTGNVIDIAHNSTADGAALDAFPLKLFGNDNQLWAPLNGDFPPAVDMVQPSVRPGSNNNYFLWNGNCPAPTNLTGLKLIMHVTSDLVSANGFSLQWNGWGLANATVIWQQYQLLVGADGKMQCSIENWPGATVNVVTTPSGTYPVVTTGPNAVGFVDAFFPLQPTIPSGTLPGGYSVEIELYNDTAGNIIGAQFTVLNQGNVVAQTTQEIQNLNLALAPGSPTNINVPSSLLAPIVGFQVALVGYDNSRQANFMSGLGKITVTSATPLTPIANLAPCMWNGGTAESSNIVYSQLPANPSQTMFQSFGSLNAMVMDIQGDAEFVVTGVGFFPNDPLTLAYVLTGGGSGFSEDDSASCVAAGDSSFSCTIHPPNYPGPAFATGTVSSFSVTVRDQHGDYATASCQVNGEGRITNFQRGQSSST